MSRSKLSAPEHVSYESRSVSQKPMGLEEADPIQVFDAVKDYLYADVAPKFSTTRQHHRAPYPETATMVKPDNFAKYIKLEPLDRKKHLLEDISHKLTPFKNRISVRDQYKSELGYQTLAQVSPATRS